LIDNEVQLDNENDLLSGSIFLIAGKA